VNSCKTIIYDAVEFELKKMCFDVVVKRMRVCALH